MRYAIVVAKETHDHVGWGRVVRALEAKRSARVFHWGSSDDALRGELGAYRPRYVCFIARPAELAQEGRAQARTRDGRVVQLPLCGVWYQRVSGLMCSLDADPYDDAIWAVLTGATPEDALRVVAAEPLVVRRGLSHVTSGWLQWLESGVSLSEVNKGERWLKQPGKPVEKTEGPADTTREFVRELNADKADMVSTSGHATEHDWQMGYSYRSGQIVVPGHIGKLPQAARASYARLRESDAAAFAAARLLAVDAHNEVLAIATKNPKIYYSPGNCRIARVDGPGCMALGWIDHGAVQFFGHVGIQTRSCYAWGVAEYFLALQGRFTFAESVWLNQQALRWQLSQMSDAERRGKYICCRNETGFPVQGKVFWLTTVLYGDPAWSARVKAVTDPLYEQSLVSRDIRTGETELTFTVTTRRAERPSRPAAFLLEGEPVSLVSVKEGPTSLVVGRGFALVPFWKADEPPPAVGAVYKATAIVRRTAHQP